MKLKTTVNRSPSCPCFFPHHETEKECILLLKMVETQDNKTLDVHDLKTE